MLQAASANRRDDRVDVLVGLRDIDVGGEVADGPRTPCSFHSVNQLGLVWALLREVKRTISWEESLPRSRADVMYRPWYPCLQR